MKHELSNFFPSPLLFNLTLIIAFHPPLHWRMGKMGLSNEETRSTVLTAPLSTNFNDRIRPLLNAVDNLRNQNIMQEGIDLPTIVVIGDQSSFKSSVLECLAGISLPRRQNISSRTPLIMHLQNHPTLKPEIQLEYEGKVVTIDEDHIAQAISIASNELTGDGKFVSNTPLTIIVKKKSVPDLTMVDLPSITRVPVQGQPDDAYEQLSNIIMEYISPKESIILNVLSVTSDFSTCESYKMSQKADKTGERTLVVITRVDEAPEGRLEKIMAECAGTGLGYVFVMSRAGGETFEETMRQEENLFKTDAFLSKMDKSILGIPVLSKKLVQIQANNISKCLPDIVKKIDEKLSQIASDLKRIPQKFSSAADSTTAFMQVLGSAKESLNKIFIRGEFDDYLDEKEMHCAARMAQMLNDFSEELKSKSGKKLSTEEFLIEEIRILEETKGTGRPNFLPRAAFLNILQTKVKEVSHKPVEFVKKAWSYMECVIVRVLLLHSEYYPHLHSSTIKASRNLISKMRDRSIDRVLEIVEMEKLIDYTSNPEYVSTLNGLMAQQKDFIQVINDPSKPTKLKFEVSGEVEVGHLREHPSMSLLQEAIELKMRLTAYWMIVVQRLVDNLGHHLLFSVQTLVNKEMEKEIVNEIMQPGNGGIKSMMDEPHCITAKRAKLNKSIKLLKESKEVLWKGCKPINHPADPNHSLIFLPYPAYPDGKFKCDACGQEGDGFCYHCSPCKLDIHMQCAFTPFSLNHTSHPHPLNLAFCPANQTKTFSCNICQTFGSNHWLYRCNICQFDAHLGCVTVKPIIPGVKQI